MNKIFQGDSLEILETLPNASVDCVMTSPPYWALRDYGVQGQLGMEQRSKEYIDRLLMIFAEVKRVLKPDGTCFVNIGDTYYGGNRNQGNTTDHVYKQHTQPASFVRFRWSNEFPDKCLCQIPSRFAIGMVEQGWILRNEIVWHKPNCMPQSITDRFTNDHEKIFFFAKNKKYFFNQQYEPSKNPADDIRRMTKAKQYSRSRQGGNSAFNSKEHDLEKVTERMFRGRNKRSVWSVPTKPFKGAHFAVFPEALAETPILAGCPEGGVVLDPFLGSGTTAVVAKRLGRQYIGIEINPEYIEIAEKRIANAQSQLFTS